MPSAISYLLTAFLGLLAGGLLNVLADDLPQRRPPGLPACHHCGQVHPPHYWLAVVGYLFGGRCPRCGSPVRLRNVLVEVIAALALVYLWSRFGATPFYFAFTAIMVAILLLVTVIDVEHRLILRVVMGPAVLLALLGGVLDPGKGWERALLGGGVGFGVTYLFYVLGGLFARAASRVRGTELTEVAFGWGDVMLGTFIGVALGWPSILFALLIAVFAGGLAGAVYLVVLRLLGRGSAFVAIPYGPFLALGCLVMLVWADEFVRWYFGG
jgi:leader peptidase (prepilin peptidase)/N-methyltransferase